MGSEKVSDTTRTAYARRATTIVVVEARRAARASGVRPFVAPLRGRDRQPEETNDRHRTGAGRARARGARAVWREGETEWRDVPIHRDGEGGLHDGSHCGVSDKCGR